mgnify:FL=1
MKKFLKVDEEVVKTLRAAGRADLLESRRTIEKADFTTEFSKENLEKAIKYYDIVVVQDGKINSYKNRVGKEFKVYFRTLPKESEKTEAVVDTAKKKKKKDPEKTEAVVDTAKKKKKKDPEKTEAVVDTAKKKKK